MTTVMITVTAASRMSIDSLRVLRPALPLLLAGLLAGCDSGPGEAPARAPEPRVRTPFPGSTELFVEFAPLVAGERGAMIAHFTRLADYQPVTEGHLDVILSGGDAPVERFRIESLRAPGIFRPTIAPRAAGERQLRLELSAPGLEVAHDLGLVVVHASREAAARAPAPGSPHGEIGFFKEQQWQADFAIEEVRPRDLRSSVTGPARVRAAADGEFIVTAPVAGLLRAPDGFPVPGASVEPGQVIALLVPRFGTAADSASLEAERIAAQAAVELAEAEVARMERLYAQQAVAARRLEEARAGFEVAHSRLRATAQRLAQLGGDDQGGIALRTPIGGSLAWVHVAHGAAVEAGERLFHVVDRRELWLEVQVAEADAPRLQSPTGVAIDLPGVADPVELRLGDNARLVGAGQVIDPASRSLPVLFAWHDPDPRIRINQRLEARIFSGQSRQVLSVPTTAVIDDGGQRVVYVMVSGESFTRRPVRLGERDGNRIEVREGLAAGDRVVARGAMQVRQAAATPEAMGHGHAH